MAKTYSLRTSYADREIHPRAATQSPEDAAMKWYPTSNAEVAAWRKAARENLSSSMGAARGLVRQGWQLFSKLCVGE